MDIFHYRGNGMICYFSVALIHNKNLSNNAIAASECSHGTLLLHDRTSHDFCIGRSTEGRNIISRPQRCKRLKFLKNIERRKDNAARRQQR